MTLFTRVRWPRRAIYVSRGFGLSHEEPHEGSGSRCGPCGTTSTCLIVRLPY